MEMDINDFGLQQEAFGFGNSYGQMSRSNTNFLNLFGSGDSPKAKNLKKDYYQRIDALPASDKAGKDALFAELEAKLAALNASQSEISDVQKAKEKAQRGEKISGLLQRGLDIFTKTTEALGMGKNVGSESQGGGGGSKDTGQATDNNKMPMWVWIAGGAVVLGLGIFAIYKFRK